MRTHIAQVKALLRGDIADIDGGFAQIIASDGWLPDRPINVPIYMAGQGPKARALAKEITDGLDMGEPAGQEHRQAGARLPHSARRWGGGQAAVSSDAPAARVLALPDKPSIAVCRSPI